MQMRQAVLFESVEMLFSSGIKATDLTDREVFILTTQVIEALFPSWNFIHLFACFQQVFLIVMSFSFACAVLLALLHEQEMGVIKMFDR